MKYSIITINYNNALGLRKTIESVVNQTYRDFEYIIIDGGSTDGSVDVIKEYETRITYWVSEADNGIYNAMNKGVRHASGEYCNFMNSGDCFCSNFVLRDVECQLEDYDFVIGNSYLIDANNEVFERWSDKVVSARTFIETALSHQSAFIKRKWLVNVPYDESLMISSDWKHMLECIVFKEAKYKGIDIWVSKYDETGISHANRSLRMEERRKVISDFFPGMILKDYDFFLGKDVVLIQRKHHPYLGYIVQRFMCLEDKRRTLIYKLKVFLFSFKKR